MPKVAFSSVIKFRSMALELILSISLTERTFNCCNFVVHAWLMCVCVCCAVIKAGLPLLYFLSVFPGFFLQGFPLVFPRGGGGPHHTKFRCTCVICVWPTSLFSFSVQCWSCMCWYMYPKMFSGCTTGPKHSQCYVDSCMLWTVSGDNGAV